MRKLQPSTREEATDTRRPAAEALKTFVLIFTVPAATDRVAFAAGLGAVAHRGLFAAGATVPAEESAVAADVARRDPAV